MTTLTAVEFVSLDGVMQAPGRPDEDPRGGFDRGGWASAAMARDPEAAQASMGDPSGTGGAMLFGRRTYLDLVGHWLGTTEPNPFTEVLRETQKYVVSNTLTEPLEHARSMLLSGDPVESVTALKAQVEGDVVILGSGQLVRALTAARLVDRYQLTILPVVIGSGARLFEGTPIDLEVENTFTSPTGIVVGSYRLAAPSGG